METLRTKLIKLAYSNPKIRPHILPILKVAFKPESEEFVDWVQLRAKKYSENEVQQVLERLGVPAVLAVEKKSGPFSLGEQIIVDMNVNTNEMNVDACKEFHRQTGRIVDIGAIGKGTYSVEMDHDRKTVLFHGKKPGKDTGLNRYTPPGAGMAPGTGARVNVEVVYLKDPNAKPTTKTQREIIDEYIGKGLVRGEMREDIYYSGPAKYMTNNKEGQMYFLMDAIQRPGHPTNINPTKGTVLYIGGMGKRPGGWKSELEQMVAQAETEASGQE